MRPLGLMGDVRYVGLDIMYVCIGLLFFLLVELAKGRFVQLPYNTILRLQKEFA